MKLRIYMILHLFMGLALGYFNNFFLWGLFVGGKGGELWYKWGVYNEVRVRRFTRKHHKYVEEALEYVSKERIIIAYMIQKSWDHYSGDWEGYHLDILLDDDTKSSTARKRVGFQQELWEHMDDLYHDRKKQDLFALVQTNTFHADNYEIHKRDPNYECHMVLSNANIEIGV